jgi:hypothetical protein
VTEPHHRFTFKGKPNSNLQFKPLRIWYTAISTAQLSRLSNDNNHLPVVFVEPTGATLQCDEHVWLIMRRQLPKYEYLAKDTNA